MNSPSEEPGEPPVEKVAYKLSEAAAPLSISEITVRRLGARGELRPVRAIRHLIFSRGELLRFLKGGWRQIPPL